MYKMRRCFIHLAALIACSIALNAAAPKGWLVAGSLPADYESGIDVSAVHNYRPSAYLKSTTPVFTASAR